MSTSQILTCAMVPYGSQWLQMPSCLCAHRQLRGCLCHLCRSLCMNHQTSATVWKLSWDRWYPSTERMRGSLLSSMISAATHWAWPCQPMRRRGLQVCQPIIATVSPYIVHVIDAIIHPGQAYGNEEFSQAITNLVPEGHTFKAYPIQFPYANARRSFSASIKWVLHRLWYTKFGCTTMYHLKLWLTGQRRALKCCCVEETVWS